MRRAYSETKRTRLTAVKDAYDPDNVFHLNHNIAPEWTLTQERFCGSQPGQSAQPSAESEARGFPDLHQPGVITRSIARSRSRPRRDQ